MVSHGGLSDSKSPQISRTLLNILADLNNAVVWIVTTLLLISKSSSPFTSFLRIVPTALITIGITVTFMFHSFFNSQARSKYLTFFQFYSLVKQNPHFHQFFFVLIITRSGRLVEIRWSVCISKPQRSLCVSFSRTDSRLCVYHLFVWSNLNFWQNSEWITFPTQLCLVLYSLCANLLHSLIMWLIVSSLSTYNQHLLFCCILSILALIWSVLTTFVLCCYKKKFSFSLLS